MAQSEPTAVDGAEGPAGAGGSRWCGWAGWAAGADGADGIDGADGAVGPVGPPGADGADGIDGVDGAVGPAGEAMTFGVVGATGAAGPAGADGAAGPLSGLTCGADEFAASFNGVWQCAVLGVTADGIFSGDGTWGQHCCDIGELVNVRRLYVNWAQPPIMPCDDVNFCFFRVVGVADHTVCTITGAIGDSSFNTGSPGVDRTVNHITVTWTMATGFRLDGNGAVSVQVSCGQGVIPAT